MPTGNTQQQINYGATANDGQGDPLRTAFIKTDDNFDNIWLAGPAGSNVRITNNTIGIIDTNGNLILSPNGVGVIQTNNHVVPRLNKTYDLGSANLQYRTVYANSATLQTLSVSGNLTVSGNIINTGNIVTDTLTIQLANTTTTANAANGAGITVGASDNIATILYNSASNVWTTNIGLSATGNITAPYFIGNGSQLTGITSSYGNSNVTTLLGNLGSNVISGTGNITTTANISGGNILGNGRQLTGIVSSYGNANVVTLLSGFGSNTIATTGNVSAGNVLTSAEVIASGVIQSGTGLSTGGYLSVNGTTDLHDTNVIGTLSVNVIKSDDSTIVQIQDGLGVDGNVTADYFIGNGSQLTGLPAQYGNSNVTTLLASLGANTISGTGNISAGNVSATGNISGAYVKGNGSELTNLPAPTVTQDITSNGAMSIMTYDGVIKYVNYATVEPASGNIAAGNISTTGNVTGNYFVGNGSQLTGISVNTGNVTFSDQVVMGTGSTDGTGGLYLAPGNNSIANSAVQYLRVRGGDVVTHIHLDTGNNQYYDQYFGDDGKYVKLANTGNVVIGSDDEVGNSAQWTFGTSGNLTLPRGGVVYETNIPDGGLNGNTIALKPSGGTNADQQLLIYPTTNDANHLHLTTGNLYSTELFLGDDNLFVKLANTGNVVINSNDGTGNTAQWTFGTTGNLTLPGNTFTVNYANGTVVSLGGNYGNANVAANLAAFGSNPISTTGNITAGNFVGNISITGNVVGTQPNVTLVAGSYSTVFDNTGNLTLPGNTFSVNYANNTPVNAVTRFESSWTVPVGNSTQSFTVTAGETYYLWVDCNIANGILAWNATATVTNTNVPVVGAQYAWVYNGGGTPIDFTSIPNQFVGTGNTIVRSSVAPSATTNRFDFGLNNTSGGNVTVRYGWIAIS